MKITPFLIFLSCALFHNCSSKDSEQLTNNMEENSGISEKYSTKEYSDSVFKYVEKDSANYRITQKYFLNGEMFAIHKVDTINKIDSITYYKQNRISYTGQRTYPNGIDIGKWHTPDYSKSRIDANYDDSLEINYWEAIEIAKKNKFTFPKIEVLMIQSGNKQWGIYRIDDAKFPQSIMIDCKTGKMKKLEYNLKSDTDKIRL